ncbi:hypothetical protein B0H14DRAFT_3424382 [Mycena olivaceomarginata]|nr:hypothetical protein B0H14DRAFT_3424382 [Mycena olivaceomarginata]
MLTVMGVVIGFVISYRAMSGYDCYWMGHTAWIDVICNTRTMAHLIWYHVPPRLTLHAAVRVIFAIALKHHLCGELGIYYKDLYNLVQLLHDFTDPENSHPTVASAVPPPPGAAAPALPQASSSGVSTLTSCSGHTRDETAFFHARRQPRLRDLDPPALLPVSNPTAEDGVAAGGEVRTRFAVSLKHHLHGELGIYYGDLYDLVRPLHDFTNPENPRPPVTLAVPPPLGAASPSPPQAQAAASSSSVGVSTSTLTSTSSTSNTSTSTSMSGISTATLKVAATPQTSLHQPLLPVSNPAPEDGVLRRVSLDVIPFAGVLTGVGAWVRGQLIWSD